MSSIVSPTTHVPRVTRRHFVQLVLGAPTLASALSLWPVDVAAHAPIHRHPVHPPIKRPPLPLTALDQAYVFLDQMMDLYGQGTTIRVLQSYVPTTALNLGDTAFTYDNAVALIAFLSRGQSGDLQRATVLGNSLVYGQQHDPSFADGRLRDGYHANPYVIANGQTNVHATFAGSQTGNLAWAGLALAHLYASTQQQSYLNGAVSFAKWIQQNTYDTSGSGGYTAGVAADQSRLLWKGTEHNIDVFALFALLSRLLSSDFSASLWAQQQALHAQRFVQAMWNSTGQYFWTGTNPDGTINMSPIPEDVQSWSYLAMRAPAYTASLDWAKTHLAAVDGAFTGVSFSTADTTGVWFEGTAHLAAALLLRNASGDSTTAATYLQSIEAAQLQAPNNDQMGIVAASHDGLHTGFGYDYFAALHVGATAWYCIAKQQGNPLV